MKDYKDSFDDQILGGGVGDFLDKHITEKSAQKMFEELGYILVNKSRNIRYERNANSTGLLFIRDTNDYTMYSIDNYSARPIGVELHKAIYQQLKELNWL